ncbi:ureidoglycolate lyase [Phenylobacterium sp.]|jgi:ureidoglycolate lyase|uniref:ureidoglycolate lyase n=1 Tax=Phenylobacterium sp. TaxID=1871053 RepID=UPI002F41B3BB
MRLVVPQPLTPEAFAPFGDVIEASDQALPQVINHGHTRRYHDLAGLDVAEGGGRPIVSIFRGRPLAAPILKVVERHPLGSQAFIPLQHRDWLAAVAPPGDFDPKALTVFRATGRQGVNYRRGVWHHFLLALQPDSDFLVIERDGPGDNCDEILLDTADQLEVLL